MKVTYNFSMRAGLPQWPMSSSKLSVVSSRTFDTSTEPDGQCRGEEGGELHKTVVARWWWEEKRKMCEGVQ